MREYLQNYIDKHKSSILYICGHPGQGKTAVLDQVLNDYFKREELVIFKYNAMSFESLVIFLHKFVEDIKDQGQQKFLRNKREKRSCKTDLDGDDIEHLSQTVVDEFIMSFQISKKQKMKFQFLIVIDEIDNFSRNSDQNSQFKNFLSIFMNSQICPKIVGIANSVELFKGELTVQKELSKQHFESQDRLQIIFDPYLQEDLTKILFYLLKHHFEKVIPASSRSYFKKVFERFCTTPSFKPKKSQNVENILRFIDTKAIDICSQRMTRHSGDLRVCFEIMKNTFKTKLLMLKSESESKTSSDIIDDSHITLIKVTAKNTQDTMDDMFTSKLVKLTQSLPRSHIIILKSLFICYKKTSSDSDTAQGIPHDTLISAINGHFVRKLGLDKFMISQVYDILKSLESADILQVIEGSGKGTGKKKSEI